MNRLLTSLSTPLITTTESGRVLLRHVNHSQVTLACQRIRLTAICLVLIIGGVDGGGVDADDKLPVGCAQETQAQAVPADPAPAAAVPASGKDEVIDLLAGDFNAKWQIFSSDATKEPAMIWKVLPEASEADRVLSCSGNPKGFAFTTAEYTNFELTLEWKYPEDPTGNSGVLIYTQNEPRIWPTAIQVQLHQPKAGSIFPSGDAVTDNTLDAAPELARPVNVWNECRINSRDGRIIVEINGKRAGEITGAKPASGRIALQSEGSAVQFRRIRLRNLTPAQKTPAAEDATLNPGKSGASF